MLLKIHLTEEHLHNLRRQAQSTDPDMTSTDIRAEGPVGGFYEVTLSMAGDVGSLLQVIGGADVAESPEVIVTRHGWLGDYLKELYPEAVRLDAARGQLLADIVKRKHVAGHLPDWMAALASAVTVVPVDLPRGFEGELDLERGRRLAGSPVTYRTIRL